MVVFCVLSSLASSLTLVQGVDFSAKGPGFRVQGFETLMGTFLGYNPVFVLPLGRSCRFTTLKLQVGPREQRQTPRGRLSAPRKTPHHSRGPHETLHRVEGETTGYEPFDL